MGRSAIVFRAGAMVGGQSVLCLLVIMLTEIVQVLVSVCAFFDYGNALTFIPSLLL